MRLPACLKGVSLISLVTASLAVTVNGEELLKNGGFEAGRLLTPWVVQQVPGSSIATTAENSPFHPVYPDGSSSVLLKDDDSSDFLEEPSLKQSFEATEAIVFGFDFKMPTLGSASPWYVAWRGENETTAFFFSLGGMDGLSVEFNQQPIATLKPDVWYHVEGWADAPHQRIEGAIIDSTGARSEFQGGFPFGVKNELSSVVVSDGDPGRNPDVLLDNFYSRSVTLEIRANASGQPVLTWLATTFTLEATEKVGADEKWTPIPEAHGSYTNLAAGSARFFRLSH